MLRRGNIERSVVKFCMLMEEYCDNASGCERIGCNMAEWKEMVIDQMSKYLSW